MRRLPVAACLVPLFLGALACGKTTPANDDAGAPNVGSASIGPIDVPAGTETTVCILKRLDTTEDIMATSFVADLAPGSHHMIVYRSTATDEQLDPFDCVPFLGLIDQTAVPLMLVNKLHLEYTFPPNVGIVLPAGQMLKIEAHYINALSTDLQGHGTVTIQGLPVAQAAGFQSADFAFWGSTKIDIQPLSTFTSPVRYQGALPGTSMFAVTSHQHELGTEVKIWKTTAPAHAPSTGANADAGDADASTDAASEASGDDAGPLDAGAPFDASLPTPDPSLLILDETNWSNPQLKLFDPPITFDGTDGFSYQCTWTNSTDQEVQFGESALDEMCFIGGYYYPSQGFDICLDGRCKIKR